MLSSTSWYCYKEHSLQAENFFDVHVARFISVYLNTALVCKITTQKYSLGVNEVSYTYALLVYRYILYVCLMN